MHIEKTLRVVGIVTAALALATMIGGGLVTSSHAQGKQKFTAKMTGKEVYIYKYRFMILQTDRGLLPFTSEICSAFFL